MPITFDDHQQAALEQVTQIAVVGVKIDLTTDLRYCNADEPTVLNSEVYSPADVWVSTLNIGEAWQSKGSVSIGDLSGDLGAVWYGERFSGVTVTVIEAVLAAGALVIVRSMPWVCTTAQRNPNGTFVLNLSGAGGLKPRGGLEVADRDAFHLAPEPGTAVRVGGTSARV